MRLADALAATPERHTGPQCSVGRALVELDGADADALRAALADETITAARLAAALRSIGVDVGHATINRHRRRDCRCG